VTQTPQSTPARSRVPSRILLVVAALVAVSAPLSGQTRRTAVEADFVKEPGGTVLARVAKGPALRVGASRGTWQEVVIEGYIASTGLRNDSRDGFDVAVNLSAGAPIRAGAGTGATLATARAGALFTRLGTQGGWIRVRRTGWIPKSALEAAAPPATPAQAPPPAPATTTAPTVRPPADSARGQSLGGGAAFASEPGGAPVTTFESPHPVEILERRGGWARVRLEGWVREGSLGATPPPDQITAKEIRDNPDRYVGQTLEWTLQVLAVQQADELRPELPPGQPYVLARGPLPETGFVYLVVKRDEVERFRSLEPLAEIRVRATVRAGRTRFLPTPVLDFVRRLD
jgi:hypothetical protein